ncbi:hypothetical protein CALCODRAFT_484501 [Calocera cornea HHB12733]|uniref:Uncharacterized protein n=1 Tax=Calocera cornea HHB12733 TaxID=1353952 RepID=A0A165EXM5_9BASI|nr:hypothetical protein CALCODRAFT_484501 [Calocera cornea HHB12733]
MPAELRLPRRPASLDLWYPPYPSSSSSSNHPNGPNPSGPGSAPAAEPLRVRFPAPLPYLVQRTGREDGPGEVDPASAVGSPVMEQRVYAGRPERETDGERERERRDIEAHLSVLRAAHRIPLRPSAYPSASPSHTRSFSLPHPVPRTPPNRTRGESNLLPEEDEDGEEGEDELLFRASLLTGSNARLRRRGAIRLSLPNFDAPLPSAAEYGEVILCGRGWAAGARLSSGGRAPPRPVGGCGGVVHRRVRREEGVFVAGARDGPERLVREMRRRKRLGCGCEVELLGCTACGTPLGTHTTHLCKLHSLRHSPAYKARYRFLPSRVFPAGAPLLPPYSSPTTCSTSIPGAEGVAAAEAEHELEGFRTPPASPGPGENLLIFDPNGDPESYPTLSPSRASCTPSPVPPSPLTPTLPSLPSLSLSLSGTRSRRPTLPPLSPVPALSLSPLTGPDLGLRSEEASGSGLVSAENRTGTAQVQEERFRAQVRRMDALLSQLRGGGSNSNSNANANVSASASAQEDPAPSSRPWPPAPASQSWVNLPFPWETGRPAVQNGRVQSDRTPAERGQEDAGWRGRDASGAVGVAGAGAGREVQGSAEAGEMPAWARWEHPAPAALDGASTPGQGLGMGMGIGMGRYPTMMDELRRAAREWDASASGQPRRAVRGEAERVAAAGAGAGAEQAQEGEEEGRERGQRTLEEMWRAWERSGEGA